MIRAARHSDRQALAELADEVRNGPDADRRSLGLPTRRTEQGRFSIAGLVPSWLPLRAPSVHLVYEDGGRILGSCLALEEPHRDDWVVVELNAADHPMAMEIRYDLLRALVEAGSQRSVARYHVACAHGNGNLELFSQLGFVRYAEEEIAYRPPEASPRRRRWLPRLRHGGTATGRVGHAEGAGERSFELVAAGASDAWHLFRLWSHVTPAVVARLEGYQAADWEGADAEAVVPRSSLTPLLRFAEVRSWLVPDETGAAAFVQYGAGREGPHYLRVLVGDRLDPGAVLESALDAAGPAAAAAGLLMPLRGYEMVTPAVAESAGFETVGRVTLLVREVRAAVRQPAMVPAVQ